MTEFENQPKLPANPSIGLAESGLLPDWLIRTGIRRLCRQRLIEINSTDCESHSTHMNGFVDSMNHSSIALLPDLANEQHYEVPPVFFTTVLGRHRKYSSCFWDNSTRSLDDAEERSLQISCDRAGIKDGMKVLDLGCGWGSLSLWIAEKYPNASVTSVSNSKPQKKFIEDTAKTLNLRNIQVITCDMNNFEATEAYDRIVSIEMFEHMRNYQQLFGKIDSWLKPEGKFFMHIFCHRNSPYEFIDNGPADWMSRHFFSGGIMPSADLPLRFQRDLKIENQWKWSGKHYEKTANAWLKKTDQKTKHIKQIFSEVYGENDADKWIQRWRIFFMACAELFAYDNGQEWFVSHYLFKKANQD
jgi:cyclopropane-fatty-acyl-phospholipid synthase